LIEELTMMFGTVTPALVYRYFNARGFYNQRTGKPFSRQSLYNHMKIRPTDVVTRMYRGSTPLVLLHRGYPKLSGWMAAKLQHYEIKMWQEVKPFDCADREVYGWPSIPCMLAARAVYVLYVNGIPVTEDVVDPGSDYVFKRVTCKPD